MVPAQILHLDTVGIYNTTANCHLVQMTSSTPMTPIKHTTPMAPMAPMAPETHMAPKEHVAAMAPGDA